MELKEEGRFHLGCGMVGSGNNIPPPNRRRINICCCLPVSGVHNERARIIDALPFRCGHYMTAKPRASSEVEMKGLEKSVGPLWSRAGRREGREGQERRKRETHCIQSLPSKLEYDNCQGPLHNSNGMHGNPLCAAHQSQTA